MQSTPVTTASTVEHRVPAGNNDAPTTADVVQRCRAVLTDLDCTAGGCVLCQCSDFLKVSALVPSSCEGTEAFCFGRKRRTQ